MAFIDVRQHLASGREPLGDILATVQRLTPGESLVIVAPFEPFPLYYLMEARGFGHETERGDDGGWRVTFRQVVEEDD